MAVSSNYFHGNDLSKGRAPTVNLIASCDGVMRLTILPRSEAPGRTIIRWTSFSH